LAYSPVSGDRKSGMPADVEMPAPVCMHVSFTAHSCGSALHTKTTIFFALPSLMYCARASVVRCFNVNGRVDGSTIVDSSLPILRTLPACPRFLFLGRFLSALSLRRGFSTCARYSWRLRPMVEGLRGRKRYKSTIMGPVSCATVLQWSGTFDTFYGGCACLQELEIISIRP